MYLARHVHVRVCEDAAATGDLDVTDDLTISSTATTTVDANGIDRVFHAVRWARASTSRAELGRSRRAGPMQVPAPVQKNASTTQAGSGTRRAEPCRASTVSPRLRS
jgi:hypothetical protein